MTADTAPVGATSGDSGEQTSTAPTSNLVPASSEFDQLVEAATAEGAVTIYSGQGLDSLNAMAEDFEAMYPGIDVEVVRGTDADLSPRIETELDGIAPTADVYVSASLAWIEAAVVDDPFVAPVGPECEVGGVVPVSSSMIGEASGPSEILAEYYRRVDGGDRSALDLVSPTLEFSFAQPAGRMGGEFDDLVAYIERRPEARHAVRVVARSGGYAFAVGEGMLDDRSSGPFIAVARIDELGRIDWYAAGQFPELPVPWGA